MLYFFSNAYYHSISERIQAQVKAMVRRSNVHFKLTVLKQLTLLAMASIDANYWTKCIQHMFKEIDYYIYYDNIDTDDEEIPPVVINEPEALPMDIDVSNKNSISNHS